LQILPIQMLPTRIIVEQPYYKGQKGRERGIVERACEHNLC